MRRTARALSAAVLASAALGVPAAAATAAPGAPEEPRIASAAQPRPRALGERVAESAPEPGDAAGSEDSAESWEPGGPGVDAAGEPGVPGERAAEPAADPVAPGEVGEPGDAGELGTEGSAELLVPDDPGGGAPVEPGSEDAGEPVEPGSEDAGEPVEPDSGGAGQPVEPGRPGEPAAKVAPGAAAPGDSVTVSVTCDAAGGAAPAALDATSEAFDGGSVPLRKVSGGDATAPGAAYRGTARIAPAEDFEGAADAAGTDSAWTVDGTCPAPADGGRGAPWSAKLMVARPGGTAGPCPEGAGHDGSCAGGTPRPCPTPAAPHGPEDEPCGGATARHGVRAGHGGAFTRSVPALVAGGLLIAGAAGAAVHRLRARRGAFAAHPGSRLR
ncbi:hypothetical protein [Streptomyces leeuwenhoekii]|uniref:hypothetical protein n=1 Tax=Streptomyces leeuwenhoekii TaxID=1437453 RepID=UPI000AF4D4CC|nr:hypothetical protein [Streptomyces leeuwenhoekii]